MDWNDLKYVVAFRRGGSLVAAAGYLGIDATTVARRIRALETHLGLSLMERGSDGTLELTKAGLKAADQAESIEQIANDLKVDLTDAQNSIGGLVRVTAVPVLVNRLLISESHVLAQQYPELQLNLESENRNVSLINRETDIALRLAQPVDGGLRLKNRRIGGLTHCIYVPASADVRADGDMPWIGYQETMDHLPQSRWMQKAVRKGDGAFYPVHVCDFGGAIEAVAAGFGKSILPRIVADRDPRLHRLPGAPLDLQRDVWLVYRAEDHRLARIQLVCDWLTGLFRE